MRFLKNKILKSLQAAEQRQQQEMFSTQNVKLEENPFSIHQMSSEIKQEDMISKEMIKDEEPKQEFLEGLQNNLQSKNDRDQPCNKLGECEHKITKSLHSSIHHHLNKEQKSPSSTIAKEEEDDKSMKKKTNKNYIKNMDLNYFKAIINFVNSNIALPYLKASIQQENVKFTTFVNFMSQSKECAQNGIQAFREMILDDQTTDDESLAACKKILKQLSEIFIKYFSVNWIMHSKINSKEAYLKYRFQMLRKIRNPEKHSTQSRKRSA